MKQADLDKLRSMGDPVSALHEPRLIRSFFYGDPGVGKTDLVARIVDTLKLKPIWLTTDSGWTTMLNYPYVAQETWRIPYDSFGHIRLLVEAHDEGIEPFCNYDTLVWDTASTGINLTLRELVKTTPFPKEQYHKDIECRGHYRLVESKLKDTVDMLKDSKLHVMYTAHIRDPTDEDKGKKRFAIRPAGPEASYKVIAQEVNLIGWIYKETRGSERLIQFEPTLAETAKTQISAIKEGTYKANDLPALLDKWVRS